MRLLLISVSLAITLQLAQCLLPAPLGPDTCKKDNCENSCAAQNKSCCFCDQTRTFNLQACFCCPKDFSCCPVDTWQDGSAHCCPDGYNCTNGGTCTVQEDIPATPAYGITRNKCRTDTQVYVTVDDEFSMSLDGVPVTTLANAKNWMRADAVIVRSNVSLITICAKNALYKAGILIASDDPDLLARARWKCYGSVEKCPGAWSDINCDDSQWTAAYPDEKNDGLGSRTTIVPYIPTDTRWVWCNASNTTLTADWLPECTCRIWLPDSPLGDGY